MTPAELDAIEARWSVRACGCAVCSAPTDAQVAITALVAEVRRLQAENDRLGELAPDWVPLPNHGGP